MYRTADKFNTNKFILFYSTQTATTIEPAPLARRKKVKAMITFLRCTNTNSTERRPFLVVGRALHPKCFQIKPPKNRDSNMRWACGRRRAPTFSSAGCSVLTSTSVRQTRHIRHFYLWTTNLVSDWQTNNRFEDVRVQFVPMETTPFLQPPDIGIFVWP